MAFLSSYIRDNNYGTAVIQCTSAPGGTFPTGTAIITSSFSVLSANHLPVNFKSIVTTFSNNGTFTVQAGTYKAFFAIQTSIKNASNNPTTTYFNARLYNPSNTTTITKWVNSYLGSTFDFTLGGGDYVFESIFTLNSDTLMQIQARHNSAGNIYVGYTDDSGTNSWSVLSPYQSYAQLILQKI